MFPQTILRAQTICASHSFWKGGEKEELSEKPHHWAGNVPLEHAAALALQRPGQDCPPQLIQQLQHPPAS